MNSDSPELEALHALQHVVHRPTAATPDHEERTARRVFAARRARTARSRRLLFGGSALVFLAGISYATGLTHRLSEWFASVEELDANTDNVNLQKNDDPDITVDVEVPKEMTDEVLDAIDNDAFVHAERIPGGVRYTADSRWNSSHGEAAAKTNAQAPPK